MKKAFSGIERCSVLYIGALAWIAAYMLPYDVEGSMQRFGISAEHAGGMATGTLLVLALTAMFFGRKISNVDRRKATFLGCCVGAVSVLGMLVFDNLYAVVGLRLIFGGAVGVIIACSFSLAAHYENPEIVFAQVGMVIALLYSLSMYLIPILISFWGFHGVDIVELVLMAVGIIFSLRMPTAREVPKSGTGADGGRVTLPRGSGWILMGIFSLFASQSALLAFAAEASQSVGINVEQLGLAFFVATIVQLPTAFFLAWLGDRAGHFKPIAVALFILIGVALGMFCAHEAWIFYFALGFVNAAAMVVVTHMLAMLGEMDGSGKSSAMAGSVMNFGYAVGPAAGGFVMAIAGQASVGWLGAILIFPVMLAMVVACRIADAGTISAPQSPVC